MDAADEVGVTAHGARGATGTGSLIGARVVLVHPPLQDELGSSDGLRWSVSFGSGDPVPAEVLVTRDGTGHPLALELAGPAPIAPVVLRSGSTDQEATHAVNDYLVLRASGASGGAGTGTLPTGGNDELNPCRIWHCSWC